MLNFNSDYIPLNDVTEDTINKQLCNTLEANAFLAKLASHYRDKANSLARQLAANEAGSVSKTETTYLKARVEHAEKESANLQDLCDNISTVKDCLERRLRDLEEKPALAKEYALMKVETCEKTISSLQKQIESLLSKKTEEASRLNMVLLEKRTLECDLSEKKIRSAALRSDIVKANEEVYNLKLKAVKHLENQRHHMLF